MTKPARYFVEWYDPEPDDVAERDAIDPRDLRHEDDFGDLASARKRAAEKCGAIYERYNFRDVTPDEDPPGILWDWDERMLEDVPS